MIRIPLRDDAPQGVVGELVSDEGWMLAAYYQAAEGQPEEEVYETDDPDVTVHLIDDPVLGLRYLLVRGATAGPVVDAIRRQPAVLSLEEVLAIARSATSSDDWVDGLYFLAAAAPPAPDRQVIEVFEQASTHEDVTVRRAAVVASGYLPWEELRSLLERLAESDPDEAVQRDAAVMLEGKDIHER